jgi:hypothetical protein
VSDLGVEYLRRMTEPRDLTAEDEQIIRELLGIEWDDGSRTRQHRVLLLIALLLATVILAVVL